MRKLGLLAPLKKMINNGMPVLATVDGNIVGVQYNNQIGLSFHPELTTDTRLHEEFLGLIK